MLNALLYVSFSDIVEYWNLFQSYVDPFSILMWGLLGGALGLLLMLVLEVIFRKKILVRRKYKILKYLAYFYFAFFPFWGSFCFTQWFTLHAVEKQLSNNIPTILGESNELFNKYLKEYVEKQIGEGKLKITTSEGVDASVDMIVALTSYLRTDQDTTASKTNQLISFVSNILKSGIIKDEAKDRIAETISSNFGIDKSAVENLMDTEIQSILDTGAINTFVKAKLESVFDNLKLQILLIFLLGISIPVAEIILAHYLEKKHKEEAQI